MIVKLFVVFDSKTAFFGRPFSEQREDSAIRGFSDAVNDGSNPNNLWNKHPEDFSLYMVGEFDDQTGELIPCLPKSLITASAIKSVFDSPLTPDVDVRQNLNSPLFKNGKKVNQEIVQ